MRQKILFKLNKTTVLPKDLIDSVIRQEREIIQSAIKFGCSTCEAINNLKKQYDFEVSLEDSIRFLRTKGIWHKSELTNLDENIAKIIMLACFECYDMDTQNFFMYEGNTI